MDVKEEDILGEGIHSHWYYISKGRALLDFLNGLRFDSLLDVGAGSGIFSRQLLYAGVCKKAVCIDPAYSDERCSKSKNTNITFVRSVDNDFFKLILMMDVLEHVDDDIALLKQYSNCLQPDGVVLITVPAFPFMWSGHDVFLEHKRRYTQKTLCELVGNAGLEVIRFRFFFGVLFPLILPLRVFSKKNCTPKSDLRNFPSIVNFILTTIHDIERLLFFKFNKLFGLSIFCLVRPKRSFDSGGKPTAY